MNLLLAAAASLFLQLTPADSWPQIRHVYVVGDTVWFDAVGSRQIAVVRYCYDRRRSRWCDDARPGPGTLATSAVPRGRSDAVRLAPTLSLVCRDAPATDDPCERFAIRSAADSSVLHLVPTATPATLTMLLAAAGLETEEVPAISELVSAWATAADAIWFGLAGGFPEGDGAYGALLRFDRARRTVETIVHPGLASATVTALAVDGGKLWVGTAHPAEYGPVGSTGVLSRDLATGRWTTLDSAGARLPDKVIQGLAARDGAVYIATESGLAVFDGRASRWTVAYFQRARDGGVAYVLSPTRPGK